MKKQLCLCGCGETFTPGNNRKYKTPACGKRHKRALAKKPKKVMRKCNVCPVEFVPKNTRHVTCSPECAVEWEQMKDQRRYEKRIPATHKQPEIETVFRRADDWDHKKYLEYKRALKAPNGRVCMAEGCKAGCVGFNFFCEFHQEQNYRKAAGYAFLDEGGSARQSASGIMG